MRPLKAFYYMTGILNFGVGVVVTVYVPYLQSIGLSLSEVAFVNAAFAVTIIIAELPTGMLADGRSRAWSLKIGSLVMATSALCYSCAIGFWTAVLAEVLFGIAVAFKSGAEQAWVADTLTRLGRSDELQKVYSRQAVIHGVAVIVGGVIGAGVGYLGYRAIWLPLVAAGLLCYWLIGRYMNGIGEPFERIGEFAALRESVAITRRVPSLAWIIIAFVVFQGVVVFNHYWTPYFIVDVGQLGLAYMWVIFYSSVIFGGWLVGRIDLKENNEATAVVISLVMAGAGLFIMMFVNCLTLAIAALVIHEVGRGIFSPLNNAFVQRRVDSSIRATFGSLQSLAGKCGHAFVPFVAGLAIVSLPDTQETILATWLVSGFFMIAASLVLWVFRPK